MPGRVFAHSRHRPLKVRISKRDVVWVESDISPQRQTNRIESRGRSRFPVGKLAISISGGARSNLTRMLTRAAIRHKAICRRAAGPAESHAIMGVNAELFSTKAAARWSRNRSKPKNSVSAHYANISWPGVFAAQANKRGSAGAGSMSVKFRRHALGNPPYGARFSPALQITRPDGRRRQYKLPNRGSFRPWGRFAGKLRK